MIIDHFQKYGLRRMIGWNIVWKRMQLFASIIFCLRKNPLTKNLGMMFSPKLGLGHGRMHIMHFHFILVGQLVATIELEQHVMILEMKGQVSTIESKDMT
jgi:hypothetical protein